MLLSMVEYVLLVFLFMGISMPLIRRQVKPNLWYGFRTRKTLSDERIWYAANEFSGRLLFVAGLLIAFTALLLAPVGLIPHIGITLYLTTCWLTFVISLVGVLILSFRYLRRL